MTAIDEGEIQRRARAFVAGVDATNIREDLGVYLTAANARLRTEELSKGESAFTITKPDGSHVITVNAIETEERQRFSICHEIGHIVLKLPSTHEHVPSWAFAKRDPNEIRCDVFAAEILMPYKMWRSVVPQGEPSEEIIANAARTFRVSGPAAASRYAALADIPCALVTMERGTVRYAARSTPLRRIGATIRSTTPIPSGSVAHRLRTSGKSALETANVPQDVWFDDWEDGYEMTEMARHFTRFDTTLSLLWFVEDEMPDREVDRFGSKVEEDELLPELTGELPWPGKRKRR